jgi:2-iminoacetate synthase ThiH
VGTAGIHKIGLGVLLGLEDWRTQTVFNALHLDYLQKHIGKLNMRFLSPDATGRRSY